MSGSLIRDRSGMALVLTLLAVSFLVAVTVRLSTSVNQQMQAAANQSTAVRLDAMLLSGLHLARAALLVDQKDNEDTSGSPFDSQFDRWGTIDSALLSELFSGTLDITVTDLSGRLQANALVWTEKEKKEWKKKQKGKNKKKDMEKLQRSLWKRLLLLENLGLENIDEDQVAIMLDSLVDWLDPDDEQEENGAEKSYYSSLNPSYIPTNGPISLIEDLVLVKGWGQKILYSGLKNKDNTPSHLIACLTNGEQPGMVNINTAPVPVLQALHDEMTEELAADLVAFREDEDNKELLKEATWYRNVPGFPGNIAFDQGLITTESNLFKITVIAADKGLRRTGEGVIQRKENQEQALLYWKIQ